MNSFLLLPSLYDYICIFIYHYLFLIQIKEINYSITFTSNNIHIYISSMFAFLNGISSSCLSLFHLPLTHILSLSLSLRLFFSQMIQIKNSKIFIWSIIIVFTVSTHNYCFFTFLLVN